MAYPRLKPAKLHSQSSLQTTRRINVTDLTTRQRHKLFIDCMNQNGFTGFIKNDEGKQTYFIFCYENQ